MLPNPETLMRNRRIAFLMLILVVIVLVVLMVLSNTVFAPYRHVR